MNRNTKGINFTKIVIIIALTVMLLILGTYVVLMSNNEKNAKKTGEVMINQMSGILTQNRSDEETLVASLKEEYMIRAKTVAYMLEHDASAEYDVEELCKIANMLSVDEIHLFDETGTIYSGTRPQYYGFGFDSGEQIGYFKPMLMDKTLSMCQEVQPNTAEGKSMMYAITWDSNGERMIQVGIEPTRLLEELKNNQISNVVDSMPVYENLEIYVADTDTEEVLGATDAQIGMKLSEIGIDVSNIQKNTICHFPAVVKGCESNCSVLQEGQYVICIVQNMAGIRKNTFFSMLLIVMYLIIAAMIILVVSKQLLMIKEEQMDQLTILTSMAEIYYSMHLIDLPNNTFTEYSAKEAVKETASEDRSTDAVSTMRDVMYLTMSEEYLETGLEFSNLTTLAERMQNKKILFMDLLGKNVGWIRMSFITLSRDLDGKPQKVICTTQIIDEEKRKEELLIKESNTDKLTQCYNRRAYENDVLLYEANSPEDDFVLISMDVNGLKNVNDTLGHNTGDELLVGAAECMRQSFGDYGKVYRMGGDEFTAIIHANTEQLEKLMADFENRLHRWSGKLLDNLSVSYGYVAKREYPNTAVRELANIADKKMYEKKAKYYSGIPK